MLNIPKKYLVIGAVLLFLIVAVALGVSPES